MVNENHKQIRRLLQDNYLVFRALGDKQRQEVMFRLYATPYISVGELTSQMSLSRPAVSHHIKILKQAGLLSEKKRGVKRYYSPHLADSLSAMKELNQRLETIEYDIA